MKHRFPFIWRLSDGYPAEGIKPNGLRVFGTFVCGGGSSMGYKLAGYEHLGGVEIDPKIAEIYRVNHHPKMLYTEDLRIFNKRDDLPQELYQLDVLDGSPPCSTFSMAGSREDAWGKEKKFAEGQALQTLDDLVFVYCETILKLRPKVFILENVAGLAKGNAKSYLRRVFDKLNAGGYSVQCFLLNSAKMGVPQSRERCFVIGRKKEFNWPNLKLNFTEEEIVFLKCQDVDDFSNTLSDYEKAVWEKKTPSDFCLADVNLRTRGKNSGFTTPIVHSEQVCPTITAGTPGGILYDYPRKMNANELRRVGTFPEDYDCPDAKIGWLIGMSVPPVMMAQIAHQIAIQWFNC